MKGMKSMKIRKEHCRAFCSFMSFMLFMVPYPLHPPAEPRENRASEEATSRASPRANLALTAPIPYPKPYSARLLKVISSISAVRRLVHLAKSPVVLVPTMGALHRGHAALIDRARSLAGPRGTVVVSIFVNPTQFGPKEDFSRYPRPFAADRHLCTAHGADILFHPTAAQMYPDGFSTFVEEITVSSLLCGASRPGHFRGVCTVVLKLFQIIQPQIAVFGLKDFQQCAVIRRMVRDLDLSIKIVAAETVREPDGLALSSRNQYLSPGERRQAPILQSALLAAKKAWRDGETNPSRLRQLIVKKIRTASLARIDYVELAHATTLQPVPQADRHTVIALAVFFGQTRLIDNLLLR